jgi:hypothetical protein
LNFNFAKHAWNNLAFGVAHALLIYVVNLEATVTRMEAAGLCAASGNRRTRASVSSHFLNFRGSPREKGVIEKSRECGSPEKLVFVALCPSAREKAAGKFAAGHENCSGVVKHFTLVICSPIITW